MVANDEPAPGPLNEPLAEVASNGHSMGPIRQDGVPEKNLKRALVTLPNGGQREFYVHKNAKGDVLFDLVAESQNLMEKDYFGLRFVDEYDEKTWLYPDKRIRKQLKARDWEFTFQVKFYAPEPGALADDLTRYLLYLQIRHEIYDGKLPASLPTKILLAAIVMQAETGDFETTQQSPVEYDNFIKGARIVPELDDEFIFKVREAHKEQKGLTPQEAHQKYLDTAKKLAKYGFTFFSGKCSKNGAVTVGVYAGGICVYKEQTQIHRFLWQQINKIQFRGNKFMIVLKEGEFDEKKEVTVTYRMPDYYTAKRLYRTAVEHHTFFRLIRPDEKPKHGLLRRWGSDKFRYQGRTYFQAKMASQMFDHQPVAVQRTPSGRQVSRSVDDLARQRSLPTSPLHFVDETTQQVTSPEKSKSYSLTLSKAERAKQKADELTPLSVVVSTAAHHSRSHSQASSVSRESQQVSPFSGEYVVRPFTPEDPSLRSPYEEVIFPLAVSPRRRAQDYCTPTKGTAPSQRLSRVRFSESPQVTPPKDGSAVAMPPAVAPGKRNAKRRLFGPVNDDHTAFSPVNLLLKAPEAPAHALTDIVAVYDKGFYTHRVPVVPSTSANGLLLGCCRPKRTLVSERLLRNAQGPQCAKTGLERAQELEPCGLRYCVAVYHSGKPEVETRFRRRRRDRGEDVVPVERINKANYFFSTESCFDPERLECQHELQPASLRAHSNLYWRGGESKPSPHKSPTPTSTHTVPTQQRYERTMSFGTQSAAFREAQQKLAAAVGVAPPASEQLECRVTRRREEFASLPIKRCANVYHPGTSIEHQTPLDWMRKQKAILVMRTARNGHESPRPRAPEVVQESAHAIVHESEPSTSAAALTITPKPKEETRAERKLSVDQEVEAKEKPDEADTVSLSQHYPVMGSRFQGEVTPLDLRPEADTADLVAYVSFPAQAESGRKKTKTTRPNVSGRLCLWCGASGRTVRLAQYPCDAEPYRGPLKELALRPEAPSADLFNCVEFMPVEVEPEWVSPTQSPPEEERVGEREEEEEEELVEDVDMELEEPELPSLAARRKMEPDVIIIVEETASCQRSPPAVEAVSEAVTDIEWVKRSGQHASATVTVPQTAECRSSMEIRRTAHATTATATVTSAFTTHGFPLPTEPFTGHLDQLRSTPEAQPMQLLLQRTSAENEPPFEPQTEIVVDESKFAQEVRRRLSEVRQDHEILVSASNVHQASMPERNSQDTPPPTPADSQAVTRPARKSRSKRFLCGPLNCVSKPENRDFDEVFMETNEKSSEATPLNELSRKTRKGTMLYSMSDNYPEMGELIEYEVMELTKNSELEKVNLFDAVSFASDDEQKKLMIPPPRESVSSTKRTTQPSRGFSCGPLACMAKSRKADRVDSDEDVFERAGAGTAPLSLNERQQARHRSRHRSTTYSTSKHYPEMGVEAPVVSVGELARRPEAPSANLFDTVSFASDEADAVFAIPPPVRPKPPTQTRKRTRSLLYSMSDHYPEVGGEAVAPELVSSLTRHTEAPSVKLFDAISFASNDEEPQKAAVKSKHIGRRTFWCAPLNCVSKSKNKRKESEEEDVFVGEEATAQEIKTKAVHSPRARKHTLLYSLSENYPEMGAPVAVEVAELTKQPEVGKMNLFDAVSFASDDEEKLLAIPPPRESVSRTKETPSRRGFSCAPLNCVSKSKNKRKESEEEEDVFDDKVEPKFTSSSTQRTRKHTMLYSMSDNYPEMGEPIEYEVKELAKLPEVETTNLFDAVSFASDEDEKRLMIPPPRESVTRPPVPASQRGFSCAPLNCISKRRRDSDVFEDAVELAHSTSTSPPTQRTRKRTLLYSMSDNYPEMGERIEVEPVELAKKPEAEMTNLFDAVSFASDDEEKLLAIPPPRESVSRAKETPSRRGFSCAPLNCVSKSKNKRKESEEEDVFVGEEATAQEIKTKAVHSPRARKHTLLYSLSENYPEMGKRIEVEPVALAKQPEAQTMKLFDAISFVSDDEEKLLAVPPVLPQRQTDTVRRPRFACLACFGRRPTVAEPEEVYSPPPLVAIPEPEPEAVRLLEEVAVVRVEPSEPVALETPEEVQLTAEMSAGAETARVLHLVRESHVAHASVSLTVDVPVPVNIPPPEPEPQPEAVVVPEDPVVVTMTETVQTQSKSKKKRRKAQRQSTDSDFPAITEAYSGPLEAMELKRELPGVPLIETVRWSQADNEPEAEVVAVPEATTEVRKLTVQEQKTAISQEDLRCHPELLSYGIGKQVQFSKEYKGPLVVHEINASAVSLGEAPTSPLSRLWCGLKPGASAPASTAGGKGGISKGYPEVTAPFQGFLEPLAREPEMTPMDLFDAVSFCSESGDSGLGSDSSGKRRRHGGLKLWCGPGFRRPRKRPTSVSSDEGLKSGDEGRRSARPRSPTYSLSQNYPQMAAPLANTIVHELSRHPEATVDDLFKLISFAPTHASESKRRGPFSCSPLACVSKNGRKDSEVFEEATRPLAAPAPAELQPRTRKRTLLYSLSENYPEMGERVEAEPVQLSKKSEIETTNLFDAVSFASDEDEKLLMIPPPRESVSSARTKRRQHRRGFWCAPLNCVSRNKSARKDSDVFEDEGDEWKSAPTSPLSHQPRTRKRTLLYSMSDNYPEMGERIEVEPVELAKKPEAEMTNLFDAVSFASDDEEKLLAIPPPRESVSRAKETPSRRGFSCAPLNCISKSNNKRKESEEEEDVFDDKVEPKFTSSSTQRTRKHTMLYSMSDNYPEMGEPIEYEVKELAKLPEVETTNLFDAVSFASDEDEKRLMIPPPRESVTRPPVPASQRGFSCAPLNCISKRRRDSDVFEDAVELAHSTSTSPPTQRTRKRTLLYSMSDNYPEMGERIEVEPVELAKKPEAEMTNLFDAVSFASDDEEKLLAIPPPRESVSRAKETPSRRGFSCAPLNCVSKSKNKRKESEEEDVFVGEEATAQEIKTKAVHSPRARKHTLLYSLSENYPEMGAPVAVEVAELTKQPEVGKMNLFDAVSFASDDEEKLLAIPPPRESVSSARVKRRSARSSLLCGPLSCLSKAKKTSRKSSTTESAVVFEPSAVGGDVFEAVSLDAEQVKNLFKTPVEEIEIEKASLYSISANYPEMGIASTEEPALLWRWSEAPTADLFETINFAISPSPSTEFSESEESEESESMLSGSAPPKSPPLLSPPLESRSIESLPVEERSKAKRAGCGALWCGLGTSKTRDYPYDEMPYGGDLADLRPQREAPSANLFDSVSFASTVEPVIDQNGDVIHAAAVVAPMPAPPPVLAFEVHHREPVVEDVQVSMQATPDVQSVPFVRVEHVQAKTSSTPPTPPSESLPTHDTFGFPINQESFKGPLTTMFRHDEHEPVHFAVEMPPASTIEIEIEAVDEAPTLPEPKSVDEAVSAAKTIQELNVEAPQIQRVGTETMSFRETKTPPPTPAEPQTEMLAIRQPRHRRFWCGPLSCISKNKERRVGSNEDVYVAFTSEEELRQEVPQRTRKRTMLYSMSDNYPEMGEAIEYEVMELTKNSELEKVNLFDAVSFASDDEQKKLMIPPPRESVSSTKRTTQPSRGFSCGPLACMAKSRKADRVDSDEDVFERAGAGTAPLSLNERQQARHRSRHRSTTYSTSKHYPEMGVEAPVVSVGELARRPEAPSANLFDTVSFASDEADAVFAIPPPVRPKPPTQTRKRTRSLLYSMSDHYPEVGGEAVAPELVSSLTRHTEAPSVKLFDAISFASNDEEPQKAAVKSKHIGRRTFWCAPLNCVSKSKNKRKESEEEDVFVGEEATAQEIKTKAVHSPRARKHTLLYSLSENYPEMGAPVAVEVAELTKQPEVGKMNLFDAVSFASDDEEKLLAIPPPRESVSRTKETPSRRGFSCAPLNCVSKSKNKRKESEEEEDVFDDKVEPKFTSSSTQRTRKHTMLYSMSDNYPEMGEPIEYEVKELAKLPEVETTNLFDAISFASDEDEKRLMIPPPRESVTRPPAPASRRGFSCAPLNCISKRRRDSDVFEDAVELAHSTSTSPPTQRTRKRTLLYSMSDNYPEMGERIEVEPVELAKKPEAEMTNLFDAVSFASDDEEKLLAIPPPRESVSRAKETPSRRGFSCAPLNCVSKSKNKRKESEEEDVFVGEEATAQEIKTKAVHSPRARKHTLLYSLSENYPEMGKRIEVEPVALAKQPEAQTMKLFDAISFVSDDEEKLLAVPPVLPQRQTDTVRRPRFACLACFGRRPTVAEPEEVYSPPPLVAIPEPEPEAVRLLEEVAVVRVEPSEPVALETPEEVQLTAEMSAGAETARVLHLVRESHVAHASVSLTVDVPVPVNIPPPEPEPQPEAVVVPEDPVVVTMTETVQTQSKSKKKRRKAQRQRIEIEVKKTEVSLPEPEPVVVEAVPEVVEVKMSPVPLEEVELVKHSEFEPTPLPEIPVVLEMQSDEVKPESTVIETKHEEVRVPTPTPEEQKTTGTATNGLWCGSLACISKGKRKDSDVFETGTEHTEVGRLVSKRKRKNTMLYSMSDNYPEMGEAIEYEVMELTKNSELEKVNLFDAVSFASDDEQKKLMIPPPRESVSSTKRTTQPSRGFSCGPLACMAKSRKADRVDSDEDVFERAGAGTAPLSLNERQQARHRSRHRSTTYSTSKHYPEMGVEAPVVSVGELARRPEAPSANLFDTVSFASDEADAVFAIPPPVRPKPPTQTRKRRLTLSGYPSIGEAFHGELSTLKPSIEHESLNLFDCVSFASDVDDEVLVSQSSNTNTKDSQRSRHEKRETSKGKLRLFGRKRVPKTELELDLEMYPRHELFVGPVAETTKASELAGERLRKQVTVYHSGFSLKPRFHRERIEGIEEHGPAPANYPVHVFEASEYHSVQPERELLTVPLRAYARVPLHSQSEVRVSPAKTRRKASKNRVIVDTDSDSSSLDDSSKPHKLPRDRDGFFRFFRTRLGSKAVPRRTGFEALVDPFEGCCADMETERELPDLPILDFVHVYHNGTSLSTQPIDSGFEDGPNASETEGARRVATLHLRGKFFDKFRLHRGEPEPPATTSIKVPELSETTQSDSQALDGSHRAPAYDLDTTPFLGLYPATHRNKDLEDISLCALVDNIPNTLLYDSSHTHALTVSVRRPSSPPSALTLHSPPTPSEESVVDLRPVLVTEEVPLGEHITVYHGGRSDEPTAPVSPPILRTEPVAATGHVVFLDQTVTTPEASEEPIREFAVLLEAESDSERPNSPLTSDSEQTQAVRELNILHRLRALLTKNAPQSYPEPEAGFSGFVSETARANDLKDSDLRAVIDVYHAGTSYVPRPPTTSRLTLRRPETRKRLLVNLNEYPSDVLSRDAVVYELHSDTEMPEAPVAFPLPAHELAGRKRVRRSRFWLLRRRPRTSAETAGAIVVGGSARRHTDEQARASMVIADRSLFASGHWPVTDIEVDVHLCKWAQTECEVDVVVWRAQLARPAIASSAWEHKFDHDASANDDDRETEEETRDSCHIAQSADGRWCAQVTKRIRGPGAESDGERETARRTRAPQGRGAEEEEEWDATAVAGVPVSVERLVDNTPDVAGPTPPHYGLLLKQDVGRPLPHEIPIPDGTSSASMFASVRRRLSEKLAKKEKKKEEKRLKKEEKERKKQAKKATPVPTANESRPAGDASSLSSSSESDAEVEERHVVISEAVQGPVEPLPRHKELGDLGNIEEHRRPTSMAPQNSIGRVDANSAGPYTPAKDVDGRVIREETIEQVYRISGTGKTPQFDPNDMSLQSTFNQCVRETDRVPRVQMVEANVLVKENEPLPVALREGSAPHTTVHTWHETEAGPETVTTEVDQYGNKVTRTVKTQHTKHTVQKQTYQTYAVDDENHPEQTITKTEESHVPLGGDSVTRSPVVNTHTRTVAYEKDANAGVEPVGELVSSKTITTGNRTVEILTYKTEKDGVVETRVEHRVTIHDGNEIDHDAELAKALLEATELSPDLIINRVEVANMTQH